MKNGELVQAILAEVRAFPNRTAYDIAHILHAHNPYYGARYAAVRDVAANVSGVLNRLAKQGRVVRAELYDTDGRKAWRYNPVTA